MSWFSKWWKSGGREKVKSLATEAVTMEGEKWLVKKLGPNYQATWTDLQSTAKSIRVNAKAKNEVALMEDLAHMFALLGMD